MKLRHLQTALVTFAAATAMVYAQFSTNVWPAWKYPRAGRDQAQEVYEALRERYWAMGGVSSTPSFAPAWWRFQRFNLAAAKGAFRSVVSTNSDVAFGVFNERWLRLDQVPQADIAHWATQHRQSGGGVDAAPIWNEQSLLAALCLPTNYLDYTPWRCLSGLGPFTDDLDAVGHSHGWTNAQTAAGGTNFPTGRSAWYTTDYGWDGLTMMLPHLVQLAPSDAYGTTTASNRYTQISVIEGEHVSTWPDLQTAVATKWAAASDAYLSGGEPMTKYASYIDDISGYYLALVRRSHTSWRLQPRDTLCFITGVLHLATWTTNNAHGVDSGYSAQRQYDNNSDAAILTQYVDVAQCTYSGAGPWLLGPVGDTNFTLPAVCSEPDSSTNRVRGYETSDADLWHWPVFAFAYTNVIDYTIPNWLTLAVAYLPQSGGGFAASAISSGVVQDGAYDLSQPGGGFLSVIVTSGVIAGGDNQTVYLPTPGGGFVSARITQGRFRSA